jgi:hypothetical protein
LARVSARRGADDGAIESTRLRKRRVKTLKRRAQSNLGARLLQPIHARIHRGDVRSEAGEIAQVPLADGAGPEDQQVFGSGGRHEMFAGQRSTSAIVA